MSVTYAAVRAESKGYNEHNDCTVKAITITTGLTYAECHAAMKKAGRKNRGRSSLASMVAASKSLGYHMTAMNPRSYRAKTIRTVETDRNLKTGGFIVSTSGHVAAVLDGKVVDHSEGGLRRVQRIYSMTPIEGFAPSLAIIAPAHKWVAVPQQLSLI